MPTLYSGFPGRAQGFGLLLLRIAVGATLLAQAIPHSSDLGDPRPAGVAFGLLALVFGVFLILGLLTRITAVVIASLAVGLTWLLLMAPSTSTLPNLLLSTNCVVLGIAIVFLGPGALSLDAVLFGRRKVIIPRAAPSHQS